MLGWLYDILMSIVSFIMSLFGCEFGKKIVTFAEGTKEAEESVGETITTKEVTIVDEEKSGGETKTTE